MSDKKANKVIADDIKQPDQSPLPKILHYPPTHHLQHASTCLFVLTRIKENANCHFVDQIFPLSAPCSVHLSMRRTRRALQVYNSSQNPSLEQLHTGQLLTHFKVCKPFDIEAQRPQPRPTSSSSSLSQCTPLLWPHGGVDNRRCRSSCPLAFFLYGITRVLVISTLTTRNNSNHS